MRSLATCHEERCILSKGSIEERRKGSTLKSYNGTMNYANGTYIRDKVRKQRRVLRSAEY